MKYSVITFGCRVNQADSLQIEAELSARGGEAVPTDRAELVVVNTCSVTASADQGARQTIRRIARENPGARIVATGCYATRCADEIAALPGVVAVVANDQKDLLLSLDGYSAQRGPTPLWQEDAAQQPGQTPFVQLTDLQSRAGDGPCGQALAPGLMGRTAWTLRVQTGCEERCSYCIIPKTRGASRSRPMTHVLAEVARVVAAGYREIAITGVHLGSYGRDLDPRTSLANLLHALGDQDFGDATPLIRVSSLEPMDCTPDVLDAMTSHTRHIGGRALARFAPHFHLPLQHASTRMLAAMRRPYSIDDYASLVGDVRRRLPHAAIGSDVIVGFPGETDDDFDQLSAYLESSPLTHLHVFPYSDRPGTDASALSDRPHGSVVKRRGEHVRQVSRELQRRFRRGQAGTTRPALTIEDGRTAVTDNYIRVDVPDGHARNQWIDVVIPPDAHDRT